MKRFSPGDFIPSAALFAAATAFFAVFYPSHVSFKEQFQLFEFTRSYAVQALVMPGGLSDLAGRFLVQFFISPFAGSLILAAVITAIQRLCRRFIGNWSFLPAICIWVFLADYISVLTAPVALILVLLSASTTRAKSVPARMAESAVLYILAGPIAILYPFLPAPKNGRALLSSISGTLTVVVLAFLSPLIFFREPWRFFAGVEYLRAPHLMPVLWWLAAAILLIIILQYIPKFRSAVPALVISAAAAALSLCLSFDATQESLMRYDYLVSRGKWDRIISTASKEKKIYPRNCAAVNLALSYKNELCERMFEFPQKDESSLIPEQGNDCFQPLLLGEIYWHIGLESQARRCFFEAQESIPNLQKSARCTKRLAQTNLLMGYDKAAQPYLEKLRHTLFYSGWARKNWKEDPEFEALKARMPKNFDGYYNFVAPEKHWLIIALETKDPVLQQYLMASVMLRRDAKRIGQYLQTMKLTSFPRHIEEAVLALQMSYPELVDDITVSGKTMDSYMKYAQSGKAPAGSYWKFLNAKR